MKNKISLILIISIISLRGFCQDPVEIKLKLIDSLSKNISEYLFEITVSNKSLKKYFLQDTGYVKALSSAPTRNFFVPQVEVENNGRFNWIELYKSTGVANPDTCLRVCCKCIFLCKNESVKFQMKILACCNWKAGSYRVRIAVLPPIGMKESKKIYTEYHSNYVYFTVNDDQILLSPQPGASMDNFE